MSGDDKEWLWWVINTANIITKSDDANDAHLRRFNFGVVFFASTISILVVLGHKTTVDQFVYLKQKKIETRDTHFYFN